MKAEIKSKPVEYPCLRYHDLCGEFYVVLFSEEKVGMIVQSEVDDRPVGQYSTTFYMPNFRAFNAELVLSNN